MTETLLRAERLARGWSLTKVAGLTQIAASDLSRIERGILPAFPGWRRRLARAYHLPEAELFRPIAGERHAVDDNRREDGR